MQYIILLGVLILPYTLFAYKILYNNKEICENDETITKRSERVDECKYVNSILQKEESYNCCEYKGIICENDHIIKL